MSDKSNNTVTIKKYANRRLYNTATSTYVTLENLSQMVKEGTEFNVYDAKTSEDITRSVLTQIIVEEEGKTGQNLLPIGFLRQLIGFYGDSMQWMVPKYLEQSMQMLTKNQEQIRGYFQNTFGGMFPFGSTLEEMGKQNVAMFERTMRMFSPFGGAGVGGMGAGGMTENAATPNAAPTSPVNTAKTKSAADARSDQNDKVAEAAFTPSMSSKVTQMPTPATTTQVASGAVSGEEVQQKIAALQRQLSDLAKNKG
jgi:polyhydroxyalkanoate synthesis repressor PhaR